MACSASRACGTCGLWCQGASERASLGELLWGRVGGPGSHSCWEMELACRACQPACGAAIAWSIQGERTLRPPTHSTTVGSLSSGVGAQSLAALPVPRLPAQRDSFFIFFSLLLSFPGHVPCPSAAASSLAEAASSSSALPD